MENLSNLQKDNATPDYTNGLDEEESNELNTVSPTTEISKDNLLEEAAALTIQNFSMLSQIPPPSAVANDVPENVIDKVTASEGPPPGLVPPSVSPVPQENTQQESLVASMAPLSPCQPPPAPNVPTPGQSFFTQANPAPSRALDLSELVPTGDFDFFQESQVQEPPNVYMDPAVVSLGAVKPDSLVQLHEQQAQELLKLQQSQTQSTNNINAPESSRVPNIQSRNAFNGQSYTGMVSANFSRRSNSYSNDAVPDLNSNRSQEKSGFTDESSNWADQDDGNANANVTPDDDLGWNTVNGDVDDNWAGAGEPAINSNWEGYDEKLDDGNGQNDFDRTRGFNKNRGSRGNNRGFRGNRGGYGNYQNGGNRGGNGGYNNGFRNNRANNGNGGFRGSRGGPRGGSGNSGGSGGSRGGFRGRGNGYQGQRYHQQQQGAQ